MEQNWKDILRDSFNGYDDEFELIVNGNKGIGIPSLYEYIIDETDGKELVENHKLWEVIISSMSYYIDDYPSSITYKQKLWDRFYSWLFNISYDLSVDYNEEYIKEIMPKPIEKDFEIDLIKDLHYAKPGISKQFLAARYHVSERTIKDTLKKLDKKEQGSELRIAGQRVSLNLRYEDVSEPSFGEHRGSRYRYFSASSTINPIFLQMNISQVHSLLNGLKCSYFQEERDMSISSAVEIWSQLSDYTKNRIRLVYASKDMELCDFLNIVDDEMSSYKLHTYLSERELLNEGELSEYEMSEIDRKLRITDYNV